MMKIIFIITLFILTSSCATKRNLIGSWVMSPALDEHTEIIITIEKKKYAFQINGKETKRMGYVVKNNTIISDIIPYADVRDSIKIIEITKEELILNLKEKGMYNQRTFTKIN